jgi:epoxyqueuosine reductase
VFVTDLREYAGSIGLCGLGVAPPTGEVIRTYPWARSVICTALPYLPPEEPLNDNRPRGLVARFARSVDYHVVMNRKLLSLSQVILSECRNARLETCVDTSPLPERMLAILSGIAFRGWNANVFVEGYGSWVVLGEIVTDLDLVTHSDPNLNTCAECGECLKKCPTGAITEPYVVDKRRCLSAITQRRGSIPTDLRPKLENRIYGCDACQEVCPLNKDILPCTPEFAERTFPGAHPDLLKLISITDEDFDKHVRRSSIGWIGRDRIRRNAAVAAGNLGNPEAIPVLVELVRTGGPLLAEHANWAIDVIKNRRH